MTGLYVERGRFFMVAKEVALKLGGIRGIW